MRSSRDGTQHGLLCSTLLWMMVMLITVVELLARSSDLQQFPDHNVPRHTMALLPSWFSKESCPRNTVNPLCPMNQNHKNNLHQMFPKEHKTLLRTFYTSIRYSQRKGVNKQGKFIFPCAIPPQNRLRCGWLELQLATKALL